MIHHVGITVSDMTRSLAFYADLLDGVVDGPYERRGPRIEAVTGYPGIVVRQAFVIPPEGTAVVELLQYDGGSDVVVDPDNGHAGAAHVALTVPDLDGLLVRLEASGVPALSAPITLSPPLAGYRAVYVLDPDRVRVELLEPPAPRPPCGRG